MRRKWLRKLQAHLLVSAPRKDGSSLWQAASVQEARERERWLADGGGDMVRFMAAALGQ